MDSNELQNLIQQLQRHISQLKDELSRLQDEVTALEDEANSIKDELAEKAAAAMRVAANNELLEVSAGATKQRYESRQQEKQQAAEDVRSEADELSDQVAHGENVLNELQKHMSYMQDIENKAQTWVDEANALLP